MIESNGGTRRVEVRDRAAGRAVAGRDPAPAVWRRFPRSRILVKGIAQTAGASQPALPGPGLLWGGDRRSAAGVLVNAVPLARCRRESGGASNQVGCDHHGCGRGAGRRDVCQAARRAARPARRWTRRRAARPPRPPPRIFDTAERGAPSGFVVEVDGGCLYVLGASWPELLCWPRHSSFPIVQKIGRRGHDRTVQPSVRWLSFA